MKLAVVVLAALAAAAPAAAAAPRWHVTIDATRLVQWSVGSSTSCTSTTGEGQEVTTFRTQAGATVGVAGLLRPAASGLKLVVTSIRHGTLTATPSGTCSSGCLPPLWQEYTGSAPPDRCDLTFVASERSCGTHRTTVGDGHGFVLALPDRSASQLRLSLDATTALFPKGCPGYGDTANRVRGIFDTPKLKLSTLLAKRTVRLHGSYSGERCPTAAAATCTTLTKGVQTRATWTITFTRMR